MEHDINEEFSRISKEDWKELLTLIPQIEKADYSNVVTGWDYPDIVHGFLGHCFEEGIVLKILYRIKNIINQE